MPAKSRATPESIVAAAVIMLLWMLLFAAPWKYYGDSMMEFIGVN